MRQPQNTKRGRGRGRRSNGNNHHNNVPNRNTSYESNGPDVKLRGNAQQLHEKYTALAHDAASAGERISAEAYTQFADHYFRLHQAAVGVAETKRQQDQVPPAAPAGAAAGDSDNGEVGPGVEQNSEKSSEGSDAAPEARGNSSDVDAAKIPRHSGHKNGKSAVAADHADTASESSIDPLSPAEVAEAFQDKAVAS